MERPSKQAVARKDVGGKGRRVMSTNITTMNIKGQNIRVTQHGKPDPRIVQKASKQLIMNLLKEYDNNFKQSSSQFFAVKYS